MRVISGDSTVVGALGAERDAGAQVRFRARHTFADQLLQQPVPLLTEDVGTCQAAIAANDAQVADATAYQVESSDQAAFPGTEGLAAGTADDGPTLWRWHCKPCT